MLRQAGQQRADGEGHNDGARNLQQQAARQAHVPQVREDLCV